MSTTTWHRANFTLTSMSTWRRGGLPLAALALAACGANASGSGAWQGGSTYTVTADLPCDVNRVLQDNCLSCHGQPPAAAPISLASYQALTATSLVDPNLKVVQRAVLRMQGMPSQMPPPPAAAVTAADIAALQSWIAAGTPMGSCSVTMPATCASGMGWAGGGEGSPQMNPGMACISCHSLGEGPRFQIAGTVYPSLHEGDRCVSTIGTTGATVVITDAGGTVVNLPVNTSGNFYYGGSRRSAPLQLPFTAKVVVNGKERAMSTPQSNGDCNSCHTVGGANGAPGRILAP